MALQTCFALQHLLNTRDVGMLDSIDLGYWTGLFIVTDSEEKDAVEEQKEAVGR